jgi:8-oxo-dGTP pyrophosphatase MutT (NUDIX family)
MTQARLTTFQLVRTRLHLFLVALRKRLTLGARAVLIDGTRVLLIRHTYLPGWQFPGGGVEPGETAEAAAARETLEEAGYRPEGRAALHGIYLNRLAGGARDHVPLFVWRQSTKQREFVPNAEIAECQWFDVTALPADIDPGTARRIAEILSGGERALDW